MPIIERNRSTVHVRSMIRRDMPDVLNIEKHSFEYAWTEDDFLTTLRNNSQEFTAIGMVAEESHGNIAGFMVYARYPKHLELLNIAVHPGFRRQWVGHQLLSKLKTKLKQSNRPFLNLYTRESNFTAHCFFREAGFRADRVLRSYYEDSGEDAYEFYFTHRRDDA